MPTYQGWTIVSMPASPAPASIQPKSNYIAGIATNPFSGAQQIQDWGAAYAEMEITMPPLSSADGATWIAFLQSCNGPACVFQLPSVVTALLPSGMAPGTYWRLAANSYEYSVTAGVVFGMTFRIREAK